MTVELIFFSSRSTLVQAQFLYENSQQTLWVAVLLLT